MTKVTIQGAVYEYDASVKLEEIAKAHQEQFGSLILLAKQNGKLRELFHTVGETDSELSFVTLSDSIGQTTYLRSLIFLMLKAFRDVSEEKAKRVYVDYTVSNGLYCRVLGEECDEALLRAVEQRMKEIADADVPFRKEIIKCAEAIRRFTEQGMTEKANVFRYRRSSWSNMYRLDDYQDYYYAYLVPSTGYLKTFRLEKYKKGFLLLRPTSADPCHIAPYVEKEKLFETMESTANWCDKLGLRTVGDLNNRIVEGKANDLILLQEAIMEKTIGDIAEKIVRSGKRIVLIAGPSSSGKTTFSHRLSIQLNALGMELRPLACDNYFINRDEYPLDEEGNIDFESIDCVDTKLLNEDLGKLLRGEKINVPTYDFVAGERTYKGHTMQIGEKDLIMIEGIHCLNDALTYSIPDSGKFKIYIAALTTLNIDEHNFIPTDDGRLIRRIVRDARTRGYSAQDTIARWKSVRRGEENNIYPYMESAEVMVNSALIYELSVLKPYAEPLLYSVPRESNEYQEAKRLLKFFDYFLTIPSETVPANSLVREFIGGGCFGE